MRFHDVFFSVLLCGFLSCGTQKSVVTDTNDGPLAQSQFFGVRFGDSPTSMNIKMAFKDPVKSAENTTFAVRK